MIWGFQRRPRPWREEMRSNNLRRNLAWATRCSLRESCRRPFTTPWMILVHGLGKISSQGKIYFQAAGTLRKGVEGPDLRTRTLWALFLATKSLCLKFHRSIWALFQRRMLRFSLWKLMTCRIPFRQMKAIKKVIKPKVRKLRATKLKSIRTKKTSLSSPSRKFLSWSPL